MLEASFEATTEAPSLSATPCTRAGDGGGCGSLGFVVNMALVEAEGSSGADDGRVLITKDGSTGLV